MNLGRILFMALFVFSSTTLLSVSSALEAVKKADLLPPMEVNKLRQLKFQQNLEQQYRQELIGIFQDFSKDQLSAEQKNQLEEQLLNLTVPPHFKDLHFRLITAINGPAASRSLLEDLLKKYQWLSVSLSLFLINNF